MNDGDRKLFIQIIGQLLISDGMMSDEERAHLDLVMDEIELPDADRKAAMSGISLDSPIEERVRSLSPEAQRVLVAAAQRALESDGEMNKTEREMLDTIRAIVAG